MDKIIHDANSEISNLRNKIMGMFLYLTPLKFNETLIVSEGMNTDQDALRRKNEELSHSLRDKSKKLLQTQELYDKMKRRGMLDQVQTAASNAVDDTIQATATGSRFTDNMTSDNHRLQQPPLYANQQTGGMHHASGFQNPSMPPPPQRRRHSSEWDTVGSQGNSQGPQLRKMIRASNGIHYILLIKRTEPQAQATPSFHRQPLTTSHFPPASIGMNNLQNHVVGTPLTLPRGVVNSFNPRRTPLSALNVNNSGQTSSFTGYGMRAGLKVGNPRASVVSEYSRPSVRSSIIIFLHSHNIY